MEPIWVGVVLAAGMLGVAAAWRLLTRVRAGSVDPFFAIFYGSALLYLQILPTTVVLSGQRLDRSPSVAGYAFFQTIIWAFFLVPLWWIYARWRRVPKTSAPARRTIISRPSPSRRLVLQCFACGWALLYLWQVVANDGLFTRIGASSGIERVVTLSPFATVIINTFSESAYFLIAALVVVRSCCSPRPRRRMTLTIAVVAGAYLLPAALNSRLDALIFLLNLAGWMLVVRRRPIKIGAWFRRGALVAVVGFLLMQVAMNARTVMPAALSGGSAVSVQLYSPFGDAQGLNRIDCVNTIGRVGETTMQNPDGFRGWGSVQWQVRRYVDRGGFNDFRQSGETSVKDSVIHRHVDAGLTDYYSCMLVESVGSFSLLGLIGPAFIFGAGFGAIRRHIRNIDGFPPRQVLVAMFFACWWLPFEKGLSVLLLGWLNAAPVLLALLIFPPWRRKMVDHDQGPVARRSRLATDVR